jgi:NAD-dependent SIR2 family protein deacetylase
MMDTRIETVADGIRAAGCFVLLAGEELAMECGIPARPPTTGWTVYGPRMRVIQHAAPGLGHLAARRLQDAGWLRGVVTFADDVLFEEAGVRDVVALRGTVDLTVCPQCGYTEPLGCVLALLPTPHCAACGAEMRPDVVGAQEAPPASAAARARRLIGAVGTLVVAGTAALDALDVASEVVLADLGSSALGARLRDVASALGDERCTKGDDR